MSNSNSIRKSRRFANLLQLSMSIDANKTYSALTNRNKRLISDNEFTSELIRIISKKIMRSARAMKKLTEKGYWYSYGDINQLLSYYFRNSDEIDVLTALLATDTAVGNELGDTLTGYKKTTT
jgi:hypothetical protein